MRRALMRYLAKLLEEPGLKIDLVIIDDARSNHMRRALRNYDSLSALGEDFSMSSGTAASWHELYDQFRSQDRLR